MDDPKEYKHKRQPSKSELLASAKLIAGAVKTTIGKDSGKVDKVKVAAAAEDLLAAASHYGKLEGKSYGKFVNKAETYLHEYHTSHSTTTTTNDDSGHTTTTNTTTHTETHAGGDYGKYGDYLKMAQGFMKK